MIGQDELAERMSRMKQTVDALVRKGGEHPTHFELITALTLQAFAERGIDYCVIEVGLGGRWDATNIIEPPLVAAITSISYDHTQYLGDTLRQIAQEKCGIFKNGAVAVASGVQQEDVCATIAEEAAERGVPLVFTDPDALRDFELTREGSHFVYKGTSYSIGSAGTHQIHNAMTAIECAFALRRRGVAISDAAIANGLDRVRWKGRLHIVGEKPTIVLDVAHNPSGMSALREALDTIYAGKRVVGVVGMSGDKRADLCMPTLASRLSRCYTAASAEPHNAPQPADHLAELAAPYTQATACASVTEAIGLALAAADKDDVILICGSHYIMPEAREALETLRQDGK